MNAAEKRRASFPPFETGQIWELANSQVHIVQVGKRLVHYKHFQGNFKRAPVSLASKTTLETYLIEQEAVMAKPTAAKPTPSKQ